MPATAAQGPPLQAHGYWETLCGYRATARAPGRERAGILEVRFCFFCQMNRMSRVSIMWFLF